MQYVFVVAGILDKCVAWGVVQSRRLYSVVGGDWGSGKQCGNCVRRCF